MSPKKYEMEFAGRKLILSTGELANQATSAVIAQYGETVVLATAVQAKEEREGMDFFPLTVEFEERFYAAGRIKGSRWVKREGRPSEESILSGRMIDRSIRPLFDQSSKLEIQIINTVLSYDGENESDIVGLIATSAMLGIANIGWKGPVAGCKIGRIDNKFVINPTVSQRALSDLDLVVSNNDGKVIMLEAGAQEIDEKAFIEAINFAQKHNKELIKFISKFVKENFKEHQKTKEDIELTEREKTEKKHKEELRQKAQEFVRKRINECLVEKEAGKKKEFRKDTVKEIKLELEEYLIKELEVEEEEAIEILNLIWEFSETEITRLILEESKRVDGRKLDEIRSLSSKVGFLPRTHGSGLFKRGQTQILSVATLGSPGMEQYLETMEEVGTKRYMHHYNFTPFSVGDIKKIGTPSRRDIGHGALAEKALLPVLPPKEEFPYTIRVVSEVMESNGSSSMGSACGSTLALMDAGVPIKKPVAGIAMGLASDEKGRWKVLTDLQDLEDGKGGMDFKITGTRDGITAIQMDTKTEGLTMEIVETTLKQAKKARMEILESIIKTITEPRKELSPYAPRIFTIRINPDKIRDVIGPGGKTINEIIEKTKVEIDIEQDGRVLITSPDGKSAEKAIEWVKNLTREVKAGEVFQGRVTRLMDFGAFVEILPKQEGLVHVSKMAPHRVEKPGDIVEIGKIIPVKVEEIDDMGRINLTMDIEGNWSKPERGDRNGFERRPRRPGSRPGGPAGAGGRDRGGSDRRPPRKPFFK